MFALSLWEQKEKLGFCVVAFSLRKSSGKVACLLAVAMSLCRGHKQERHMDWLWGTKLSSITVFSAIQLASRLTVCGCGGLEGCTALVLIYEWRIWIKKWFYIVCSILQITSRAERFHCNINLECPLVVDNFGKFDCRTLVLDGLLMGFF